MYTKRIQLLNYGPIEKLDIEFPFHDETPKPVVLVGENGSGKSILLSHIVNGLVSAKGVAYPDSPEVDIGKVYKLRSTSYVKSGSEYYFGKVDFEDGQFLAEIRSRNQRQEYETLPAEHSEPDIHDAWNKMKPKENDHFDSSFSPNNKDKVEKIFFQRCVLYFPPNRFEEPAWLNEENLKAQPRYMDINRLSGHTNRKVIASSPLRENQDWLFGVVCDKFYFELAKRPVNLVVGGLVTGTGELFEGYAGPSTIAYEIALQIVRATLRKEDAEFKLGRRNNRVLSLVSPGGLLVPNIFQLSSGETSLLNLFLSILRDFEWGGSQFASAAEIRGIVVVDEIDLHLHAIHQHEVVPSLIKMFPKVQFIVTTHSPLFVLGMQKAFGEDGFALYRLPQGQQISPEEFSEFGDAYKAFAETQTFSVDVQAAIGKSQKPIVFVEGITDKRYIEKAAEFFGKEPVLAWDLELRDGGGCGKLTKIWKDSVLPLTNTLKNQVLLLFDCDTEKAPMEKGKLLQRSIPKQGQNPIGKGIENLFTKSTLERALQHKPAFIDIDPGRTKMVRGEPLIVPEKWTINENEKINLCDWLCENATEEVFKGFSVVLDLLEESLELDTEVSSEAGGHEQLRPGVLQDKSAVANLEES